MENKSPLIVLHIFHSTFNVSKADYEVVISLGSGASTTERMDRNGLAMKLYRQDENEAG